MGGGQRSRSLLGLVKQPYLRWTRLSQHDNRGQDGTTGPEVVADELIFLDWKSETPLALSKHIKQYPESSGLNQKHVLQMDIHISYIIIYPLVNIQKTMEHNHV